MERRSRIDDVAAVALVRILDSKVRVAGATGRTVLNGATLTVDGRDVLTGERSTSGGLAVATYVAILTY